MELLPQVVTEETVNSFKKNLDDFLTQNNMNSYVKVLNNYMNVEVVCLPHGVRKECFFPLEKIG